ncbi:MAG: hypothetical protein IRY99_24655 [Isosphaeraceae bacterium]|nr:hypothetical protein [Isosphaeraceae bacterium]
MKKRYRKRLRWSALGLLLIGLMLPGCGGSDEARTDELDVLPKTAAAPAASLSEVDLENEAENLDKLQSVMDESQPK